MAWGLTGLFFGHILVILDFRPCSAKHGGSFCNPNPHIQGKNMKNKNKWPQSCQVCLVLKHFGPYFVRVSVHIFTLYWGGGHSRISENRKHWDTDLLPLLVPPRRGRSAGKKPVLVIIFLENHQRFAREIITSTGAKFSCNFCPSVLVLVIFLGSDQHNT